MSIFLNKKGMRENWIDVWFIQLSKRLNTLRPRQNDRHLADDLFKCIFLKENVWISIKISRKCVTKGPINNITALVQVMAWRRPGGKPLSEPMMVRSPTHICVTWLQWVKPNYLRVRRILCGKISYMNWIDLFPKTEHCKTMHILSQWHHTARVGVSNYQCLDCLFHYLSRRRSKKASKLRITGLCEGNPPVTGLCRCSDDEIINHANAFKLAHYCV